MECVVVYYSSLFVTHRVLQLLFFHCKVLAAPSKPAHSGPANRPDSSSSNSSNSSSSMVTADQVKETLQQALDASDVVRRAAMPA
jgi:hypothetical protein